VTGFVNICFSFPLAGRFGAVGACISICIAYLVRAVLCNILYHRELPLDIPRFIKECYVKMSVPILVTIACGMAMNHCIPDGGWSMFLLKAAITVMIYLLSVICLVLTRQEKQNILSWLKKGM